MNCFLCLELTLLIFFLIYPLNLRLSFSCGSFLLMVCSKGIPLLYFLNFLFFRSAYQNSHFYIICVIISYLSASLQSKVCKNHNQVCLFSVMSLMLSSVPRPVLTHSDLWDEGICRFESAGRKPAIYPCFLSPLLDFPLYFQLHENSLMKSSTRKIFVPITSFQYWGSVGWRGCDIVIYICSSSLFLAQNS